MRARIRPASESVSGGTSGVATRFPGSPGTDGEVGYDTGSHAAPAGHAVNPRPSRMHFVPLATDAPPARPGEVSIVLDTAWTPAAGERSDVVSVRPYFAAAVEREDLYAAALATLDRWGQASGVADHVLVDGVTYWFRAREDLWHWVHERLLWRHAVTAIDADFGPAAITAPADEVALLDVVRALDRAVDVREAPLEEGPESEAAMRPAAAAAAPRAAQASRSLPRAIARRIVRPFRAQTAPPERPGRTEQDRRSGKTARRTALLDERLARLLAGPKPRVVVLTLPSSYQRVDGSASAERRDPNLGSVIPALADAGLEPVVIGLGMSRQRDEDWATTELDDRLLPAFYLQSRWARPEDRDRARAAAGAALAGLEAVGHVPFEIDGLDLTSPFLASLRATLQKIIEPDVVQLARVERLTDEVRPSAFLMTQEGHRTPWLLAAERAGVPTFALQHGVLYPTHAGYPDHRHPKLILPTRTFVFGDYERGVLEGLAYQPGEVSVSGSPRVDADPALAPPPDRQAERAATRRDLGVADGDRMLVVSTVHSAFVRRSHLAHMLQACLGGPLPNIHVVFKQHPGERDDGSYRELLIGIAHVGGYEAPSMTLIKDIDLYRLLRAADAHLGHNSTVLTDAVVAGTCNLIAIVEGNSDLLGYVDAGVAQPIHDVAALRDALRDPRPPDPDARRAFLDDHLRPGNASERIASTIDAAVRNGTNVDALGGV